MSKKSDAGKKLGFWAATSLVVGSMIGSGIFSLPIALAEFGGISLFGWLFAAAGAFTIAKIMIYLSKVIPTTGGPYAYSRAGFGDLLGFLIGWGYWLSIMTTNAALVMTIISYLGVFFPVLVEKTLLGLTVGMAILWIITTINSYSLKAAGKTQVIATALKLIPLAIITIGGLFFINFAHFSPLNISGQSSFQALTVTTAYCLFAFLGLEAATIPAGSIESPEKTVPRATLLGTVFVTVIYMLSSFSLFGILPPEEISSTVSPFADAAAKIWGANAMYFVAAGACISALGTLNGWVLMQGQMALGVAKDGLFPKAFAQVNKNLSPTFGIIVSSIIATALVLLNQSKGLSGIYRYMVLLTTVLNLVAYIFSIGAFALFAAERKFNLKPTYTNTALATIAFGFSIWMIIGSGETAVMAGFIGLIAGVPVYIWNKRKR